MLRPAMIAYAANCGLGLAVASGRVHLGGFRWVHHALYVLTVTTTGLGALALLQRRDRALLRLLPVALPLALVPRVPARSRGHVLVALSAAPFYAAACRSGRGR